MTISILIFILGVLSLSFTAYQAHISEQNETTRRAAFEMLKTLNHFQLLIDKERFGMQDKERYIEGWSDVLLVNDLALFTDITVQQESHKLLQTWKTSFENLDNKNYNEALSKNIKATRERLKEVILSL